MQRHASNVPTGQPQSFYGPLKQQTQFAAYGLITSGPKAGTTFDSIGQAVPLTTRRQLHVVANGAMTGHHRRIHCFGTPSEPGDQIDTHEFTQGLIQPADPRQLVCTRVV